MSMDTPTPRHVSVQIHPDFLGTNAQSHPWPFSAIAELIDNAYDPDASAEVLHIQHEKIHGKPCLVFTDDGHGMDFEHLIKMMSFGYSEKEFKDGRAPIGKYGNGFNAGSMRLAKDALVFTVHRESGKACIGLFSMSLCKDRNIKSLKFPMVEYNMPKLMKSSRENLNMEGALEDILDVSPYDSEDELKGELKALQKQKKKSGTKIVLFNLWRTDTGCFELDFHLDPEDIRNPHDQQIQQAFGQESKTSSYRQSLRRYCSILYRKSRMQITIKGKPVKYFDFLEDLKERKRMFYKPKGKDMNVEIIFGKEKKTGSGMLEDEGVLLYHENRLIKPYVKLACQNKGIGKGVVGVADVTGILKPVQNKQDFEVNTTEYTNLIRRLSEKMVRYCEGGESDSLDDSEEEERPGPSSKGKRKSTEPGEQTAVKRPRKTTPAATHSPAVHTAPTQTARGKTARGKTAAGKTAAGKTAPDKTAAGQTAPGQTAAGQTAPGKTAADKTAAGQTASGQSAAGQTAPGKTAPGKTAAGQAAPGKAAAGKTADKTTVIQTAPGQTASTSTSTSRKTTKSRKNSNSPVWIKLNIPDALRPPTGTRKRASNGVLQTMEPVQSSSRNQQSLNAATSQQSDGTTPRGDALREHFMKFRQNVYVLLTDMEGREKIGDVDHVEESLREVLKSRGLPFK